MKEWYSVQELLKLNLPGFPGSVRGIDKLAKRQGWTSRPRQAVGGGLEYHYTALPPRAQAAILAGESTPAEAPPPRAEKPAYDPVAKAAGDAAAAQLQGRARARLDAKLAILEAMAGLTGGDLMAAVVRYNAGELPVADEVRAETPTVSLPTVHRWRDQVKRLGLARVAGRYGNRKGCGLIDRQPELAAALRGLIVETPHVRPGFAHEWLTVRYQDSGLSMPKPTTVRRWLEIWKTDHAELYCRLRDPDAWKSKYMVGWGDAAAAVVRLNQLWEFDSTPADVILQDGRHSILGVIDVYSRRVRLHVSKTSKATAVASLLRGALLGWGVPEIAKTDNGQEYVSNHVRRIFQALDIDQHLSAPFSPWEKPFIERFFRSFSHDLVEYLPGYAGHNVGEREQLRARQQFSDRLFVKNRTVELALTAAELQSFCDRWLAGYHDRPHSGLSGRRPVEVLAGWREPTRRVTDERVLDLLLSEAPSDDGWRTVTKSYGLRVDNFEYIAIGLPVGERVRVLYDPEGDMGRVYAFDGHGRFLAVAECPEITGIDRRELAARAKAAQKTNSQAEYRAAKADAKALGLKDIAGEILAERETRARALVPFPTAGVEHATPAMTGAAAALTGQTALSGGEITPEMLKAAGYTPADRSESAPSAEVIPLRSDGWLGNLRDLCARTLGRDVAPTDADADYLATYYMETRNPRIFEGEMTEKYGYARFHAWKKAVLDQAQATATRLQPMAG